MSKISPCLWFNGQAEEAARFYVSVFGGSVDFVSRYPEDSPVPLPSMRAMCCWWNSPSLGKAIRR